MPQIFDHFIAADDIRIDYCLDMAAAERPAAKLALLIHGLTGHPFEYVHMTTVPQLNALGYDVARISLYGDHPQNRSLIDSTVQTHADDSNALISHLKDKYGYQHLYAAGHSYGGLTLLLANPAGLNAAAFWDASFTPYKAFWKDNAHPCQFKERSCYTMRFDGVDQIFGEAMVQEAQKLDEQAESIARVFTAPALVILAGDNAENPLRTHLYDALPPQHNKKLLDVAGANHCFYVNGTAQELAAATCDWFEAH